MPTSRDTRYPARFLRSEKNQVFGRAALGFTLVELLVATAILALLVVILASVFGSVSKTWLLGQAASDRLQNIRTITDLMTGELRSALLPVNRTDKANLEFVVNPDNISPSFRNADAIFWQAPVGRDQTLGDVAAVGYFVKWDESNPANPRPILCRFYASESASGANFLVYSQAGGSVKWLSDQIINAVASADKANGYQGLIAENAVALFVQCLDARGKPIETDYHGTAFANKGFNSRLGFRDASGAKTADFTDATGAKSPICVLPPMVRLSFVLIDARAAARITPSQKSALISLSGTIAQQSPKGDANAFVTAALADSQFKGVSDGLRASQTEINLLNAR
ncbi:MAG: prepilin-type N-terminal cleavage/methylation domain-containing protein [Opitutaceae bacterium]|nr:prepilin-type N-terminal cleavage/methylation domain-containing protein [Verrucomicrobiales bacterium]